MSHNYEKILTLGLNESYWLEPKIHEPSEDQQDFWNSGPGGRGPANKGWNRDVGEFMFVRILGSWWQKKHVGDIFLHVSDMPIGHQHNYMPECDVGDRFVMLETFF